MSEAVTTDAGSTPAAEKPVVETVTKPEEKTAPAPTAVLGAAAEDAQADAPADPAKPDAGKAAEATDWRDEMAGGDEEARKFLGRYKTPAAVGKALVDLRKQISAGGLKKALGENATQAEQAAWRKENGIPAEPAGYLDALPATVRMTEDDKAAFVDFAKAMHEDNAPPALVAKVYNWYEGAQQRAAEARTLQDQQTAAALDDELSGEWGRDKRGNLNLADRWLAKEFGEARFNIYNARMPDGTLLANNGDFIRTMAKLAAEADGGVGLERGNTSTAQDIASRLDTINAMQNDKDKAVRDKFWSSEIQTEQRMLIEQQTKLASRKG